MRAVLYLDIVTLGRCLLAVEAVKRATLCDKVFDMAHAADKYRKRFGRFHKLWGAGSLASACCELDKSVEPFLSDPEYAHCLMLVFERILAGATPWRR